MTSYPLRSIGQIARSVTDIEAAKAWYADKLGLPLLYSFEGMAFFDLAGTRLYLQQAADTGPESILYFQVEDIDVAYAALREKGVGFARPPHRIHTHPDGIEEWLAFFADLEGRPMALICQRRS